MEHGEDKLESQSKQALSRLRGIEFEPSPFLKGRILARLEEKPAHQWLWKGIAFLSTAACMVLLFARAPFGSAVLPGESFVAENYVIQVDLGGERLHRARVAEVELPEGVQFVSKSHPDLAQARSLRLPVPAASGAHSRLPFVVRSASVGRKELKLRIYDEKGELLQERVLSVAFVGKKHFFN